eukprot:s1479_g13.t1
MSTSSHWKSGTTRPVWSETSCMSLCSIAIHEPTNLLYGVNRHGNLYKIPLNNLAGNGWVHVPHNGKCYHITISGDDIYCRGSSKAVWYQKITTLTASSSWKKVARGSVMSVYVPKAAAKDLEVEETDFEMGPDFTSYIYATGTNYNVYRQPLLGLSTAGTWQHVGKGSVISLLADGELLIGLGTDKRPYKQDFPELSTSSNWHHAARGSIIDGDTKDGIFYGVGTNGLIYQQPLKSMSTSSHWKSGTTRPVWSETSCMNNLAGNGWVHVPHNGKCYHITISGDDIYCRGSAKAVWHQKVSLLTATSSWKKVAAGSVMSVYVPKAEAEREVVQGRFAAAHSSRKLTIGLVTRSRKSRSASRITSALGRATPTCNAHPAELPQAPRSSTALPRPSARHLETPRLRAQVFCCLWKGVLTSGDQNNAAEAPRPPKDFVPGVSFSRHVGIGRGIEKKLFLLKFQGKTEGTEEVNGCLN